MGRDTKSTGGANCNACKGGGGGRPPPPPPPPPAPAPPAPAGASTCDFEAPQKPYCGVWKDSTNDKFDWTRKQGRTPSCGTGPDRAAGGKYYVFVEASRKQKYDTAILESVPTDITGDDAKVQFQFHAYSASGIRSMGTLSVLATVDGKTTQLWNSGPCKPPCNSGNVQTSKNWQNGEASLGAFSGKKGVVVSFKFYRSCHYRADWGLDNLVLYAGSGAPPAPPPPPTPTKAPLPAPGPAPPAPGPAPPAPVPTPPAPGPAPPAQSPFDTIDANNDGSIDKSEFANSKLGKALATFKKALGSR